MPQNERIIPLPPADFETYCERVALEVLKNGITYDYVIVLMNGAHSVWTYLAEVLHYKQVLYVKATRYPDGESTSRCPPEFSNFPNSLSGKVLIVDDCVDDGDTMFEAENRSADAGAALVHSAVVLCKPDNLKIKGWAPHYIGWTDAPGDIYYDFPREAFKKRVQAALQAAEVESTTEPTS